MLIHKIECDKPGNCTYAFAAVSPQDGRLDTLILPEVSTTAMNMFLREVADRHAHEIILMIMDSAGWHKAKALVIPLTLMNGLIKIENNPERVKSITGWSWIITVNLNAN